MRRPVAARVDFQASNNADWTRSFSLTRLAAGEPPWAAVTEWDAGETYQSIAPASVVVHDGDLYIAKVQPTVGEFKPSEWTLVAVAAPYMTSPEDLTGAEIAMHIAPVGPAGVDIEHPVARLGTADRTIIITSAAAGGIRLNVAASQARSLKAGKYAYDLLARRAGTTRLLIYGQIDIVEGVTA